MFSGIIRHRGILKRHQHKTIADQFVVAIPKLLAKVGDSIAVNGVCLTVEKQQRHEYTFSVMPETMRRTTLSKINIGEALNIEPSLRLKDAVDGHFVFGHVDAACRVEETVSNARGRRLVFRLPAKAKGLVAEKGSIAIDGVSLTVAAVSSVSCSVFLIPYTTTHTTLGLLKKGRYANVEFDMLARYVNAQISR